MCWQSQKKPARNDCKIRVIARETQMPHRKQKWHYQYYDAKHCPKVWQLQFHVNKTAKESSSFTMSVSCTFSAKRLQNRGIYFCKDVYYEGCWSITSKKSKMSVLAEAQHLVVNETIRYNVKLTHINLDCSCLLLQKLLYPFIIASWYPCDTQPLRGDACIHAQYTCELRIGL